MAARGGQLEPAERAGRRLQAPVRQPGSGGGRAGLADAASRTRGAAVVRGDHRRVRPAERAALPAQGTVARPQLTIMELGRVFSYAAVEARACSGIVPAIS